MLALAADMGIRAKIIAPLPPAKHIFTHIEWSLCGWMAETDTAPVLPEGAVWMADLAEYSIPSAFAAYRSLLR